jgi:hypothetical protein
MGGGVGGMVLRAGIIGEYPRAPQASAGAGAGKASRAAGVRMDTATQDMAGEQGSAPHSEQGPEGRQAGAGGIGWAASGEAEVAALLSQCPLPVIATAEPGKARAPASRTPTHITVKRRRSIIEGSTPLIWSQSTSLRVK